MYARVEKDKENGKYYIHPTIILGRQPFSDKALATRISDALNEAYKRGGERVRSDIRNIIGCAREEE